ncbi:MAG: hypothetical protein A2015_11660 [Spirochaetes bacterium GWF1_31_7]|nr:MAG: hypothetical protein A2Y30_15415 [Spirochaetes bacterium GWE1_32_154]OHD49076.1 MAG: hypothetical protein A2015_11660 [Spirochaetes bacterium GWF1_31_7]OHD50339.1 MAG: hypothetical protein A2Y29_13465 [Spirochaetes bacterium GWE2_31_10]OHD77472.1 MAG: hypothetical protein A2355_08490 [Spirochaetes bacterium RIFOXYB1_FULL_32_8]HBD93874.1 TlyA family rRNA (cytidine-2'-O)-methyltransferase [Spirochaetia bacterium]
MKRSLRDIVIDISGFDSKKVDSIIMSGKVLVNDIICYKPGEKYSIDSDFRIKEKNEYVSRAAYKLIKGFEYFSPQIKDLVCIDGGSSTGGFTQVLLQYGASKVYAVDCGSNQLDYSLRTDKKVVSMENKRVQDIVVSELNPLPVFAVADVSFTSCIPIIIHFFNVLSIGKAIILLKPQFEYARLKTVLQLNNVFSGIVSDENEREKIRNYVITEIISLDICVEGFIESPIKGASGNVEYILYLNRFIKEQ